MFPHDKAISSGQEREQKRLLKEFQIYLLLSAITLLSLLQYVAHIPVESEHAWQFRKLNGIHTGAVDTVLYKHRLEPSTQQRSDLIKLRTEACNVKIYNI